MRTIRIDRLMAMVVLPVALCGATLEFNRNVKITYDFGGKARPSWENGALLTVEGNRTAAPSVVVLSMEGSRESVPFTTPGAQVVDIRSESYGRDKSVALCGSAYDAEGRESGFIAIIPADRSSSIVSRVHPYTPYRIVMATDGTVWTAGLELRDGKENKPGLDASRGVIRHFDRTGKLVADFVPRNAIASLPMITWGRMAAATGRIGWYTGPVFGPNSEYYEISDQGTVGHFSAPALSKTGNVNGLALTDDGQTLITTAESDQHTWHSSTLLRSDGTWTPLPTPESRTKDWSALDDAEGNTVAVRRKTALPSFI